MKKLFYSIAFITLLATLTSCTADEIPTQKTDSSVLAKDVIIDPPTTPIVVVPKK